MSPLKRAQQWRKWRRGWRLCILASVFSILMVTVFLLNLDREAKSVSFKRTCRVPWTTVSRSLGSSVCLTTLSDAKVDTAFKQAARRDFNDVLDATWTNKQRYTQKHHYRLFNASDLIDTGRPPSWSKILAVKDALWKDCEWVFWVDPDSLIMNSGFRLEDILPEDKDIHLIITRDATGFNAGMWIIRRGPWTTAFLNEWWSMTDFIRKPGDTKSGDNDALKEFLGRMDNAHRHVQVAPQCAFNSYLWKTSIKSVGRYLWQRKAIMDGMYREGDFLLHFAGVDDKMHLIEEYSHQTYE